MSPIVSVSHAVSYSPIESESIMSRSVSCSLIMSHDGSYWLIVFYAVLYCLMMSPIVSVSHAVS